MIEKLLPDGVAAVETFEDVAGEQAFPGEEFLIAKAVEKRRREFITARRCAREALARLGYAPVQIHAGPKREPVWKPLFDIFFCCLSFFRSKGVSPPTGNSPRRPPFPFRKNQS